VTVRRTEFWVETACFLIFHFGLSGIKISVGPNLRMRSFIHE
jgi:hypothetical protein